ncbi:hypothetical protein K1T71_008454 [Dendrolimus kikuchii]|uniref:Uncharacterized protein n=1 Tax=Dendrolimus kikuchii TaxID=765133 RepID=A0ACC1CX85_9NEOP|nr:hypothetical protein K1T71_008454 [Dendrolimus kikuchii]
MGLPQLETCCFVLDLKTGNIILGCLNAFFSFVLFVVMIVNTAALGVIDSSALDVETQAALTGAYAMCIIMVLMFLVKLLFDIAFIYGVVSERAGIVKAYFIMWIVFFILVMFIFFLNISNFTVGHILTQMFYVCINIYQILLTHSFYKQLNSREEV